jgi:hypothetical protein
MKLLLSALIVGLGLLMSSAHASPRAGTFDDPNATVPKSRNKAAKAHPAPFRYEIAPPADETFRQRLHDIAP